MKTNNAHLLRRTLSPWDIADSFERVLGGMFPSDALQSFYTSKRLIYRCIRYAPQANVSTTEQLRVVVHAHEKCVANLARTLLVYMVKEGSKSQIREALSTAIYCAANAIRSSGCSNEPAALQRLSRAVQRITRKVPWAKMLINQLINESLIYIEPLSYQQAERILNQSKRIGFSSAHIKDFIAFICCRLAAESGLKVEAQSAAKLALSVRKRRTPLETYFLHHVRRGDLSAALKGLPPVVEG